MRGRRHIPPPQKNKNKTKQKQTNKQTNEQTNKKPNFKKNREKKKEKDNQIKKIYRNYHHAVDRCVKPDEFSRG